MKAITLPEFGGPEVLTLDDVEDPQPAAGEVVIDVVAAGVNRADVMQRMGVYPPPPGESELPGLEVSGRIAAVGSDVKGWRVGDKVCALLAGGGYAEKVAVPAAQVLPLPKGVDLQTAAGLPEVSATVWNNLFMVARLQPGETLLVHGGSSGIGTTAIQMAVARGVRVAVTAGSDDKLNICRDLGAGILINYKEHDFVEALHEATDGHGADVILDNMGAAYLPRNIEALATGGRLVIIGMQGGVEGKLPIGKLLAKRGTVTATSLRSLPHAAKADVIAQVRDNVWPLIESGAIKPIIHGTFPLQDAPQAHKELDAGTHIGKILLTTE